MSLREWSSPLGLVAILRGIKPDEAVPIGEALCECGFKIVEVPLNSPEPFKSIQLLAKAIGDRALVGAGTVTDVTDVGRVADAGGRIIVMPHSDAAIIRAAKAAGMLCLPGVASPTEAFAALAAGADGLKLFPAEGNPPPVRMCDVSIGKKYNYLYHHGGLVCLPRCSRPCWPCCLRGSRYSPWVGLRQTTTR